MNIAIELLTEIAGYVESQKTLINFTRASHLFHDIGMPWLWRSQNSVGVLLGILLPPDVSLR